MIITIFISYVLKIVFKSINVKTNELDIIKYLNLINSYSMLLESQLSTEFN